MILGLSLSIFMINILAAVLPAVFLLRYVYRHDTYEKESPGMLFRLLKNGILAAFIAILLEEIGTFLLGEFVSEKDPYYTILLAFLVVAAAEEGAKYFLMKRATWHSPEFNYRFDGIVYAVFVSLGFAAFENIEYVFGYGLSVAPARAVLAIPGHMSFAVFMGFFYGRAKWFYNRGDEKKAAINRRFGVLAAIFFHGFYDACALSGTGGSVFLLLGFVAIMYITVYRIIRKESQTNAPV